MAKMPKLSFNVDLKAWAQDLGTQFRSLDTKDPSSWPALPRYALLVGVVAAVVAGLWFAWLTDSEAELVQAHEQELKLREEYKTKLAKAVNLDALKKQREQVLRFVNQLEKQLPSKAEMDALLSNINQAGLGRSLMFELFRPGQVVIKDYYAELPIALRVTGRYHDMGAFVADIANQSRIVTLNNISIAPAKDNTLTLDATAKTFRYLDDDEIQAQRKAAAAAKGGKK
ncbi:MAG: type 4a pilus biogenesis protein PilO [Rhodoferax sp.]